MKNKIKELFNILAWIFTILFLILGLVAIAWILLELLGKSPEFEQIIVLLLTVILTGFVASSLAIGLKIGELSGKLDMVSRSLNSLGNDFKEHSRKLNEHLATRK